MCGIAGRLSISGQLAPGTGRLLKHRGPDELTEFVERAKHGTISFVHTRLAILDLTAAARQPMRTEGGRFTLTYNGEIYNFRALRRELEQHGKTFVSDGDTEVFLKGFEFWGQRLFDKLDGMYAAAIWDRDHQVLTLVRDPLGIKPLYYAILPDGGVTFASELRPILNQPGVSRTLRKESVAEYLSFLWIPEPHTMFRDIFKLPGGTVAEFSLGRPPRIERYWDLATLYRSKLAIGAEEAAQAIGDCLARSIQDQLVSDVPLGVYFSGGLDSTAILSQAALHLEPKVIAETIGFAPRDQALDIAPSDLAFARKASGTFGSRLDYHDTVLDDTVLNLLPDVVEHLGDPIGDPAALSSWMIAHASRPRATVMLSGMGAEELWGGYDRYWATLSALATWGRIPSRGQDLIRTAIYARPLRPGPLLPVLRQLRKFSKASGLSAAETFLTYETYVSPRDLKIALTKDWYSDEPRASHETAFAEVQDLDLIDQMAYVDAKQFLPGLNLAYTDRMSMAASVEVRVPFLSKAMVEMAARMPSRLRIHGRIGKYPLRQASCRLGVPKEIAWRKKTGFGGPVRGWMTRQDHGIINSTLNPVVVADRGVLNPDWVSRLRSEQLAGRDDHALLLFALTTLELWFRVYVDASAHHEEYAWS